MKRTIQDAERWTDALIACAVAVTAGMLLILIIVATVAKFS